MKRCIMGYMKFLPFRSGTEKSGYFQRCLEYSSAFEVLNTRGKLKLGRKNQSCDEKRVVDVAHVGH